MIDEIISDCKEIRRQIIKMTYYGCGGHIGSSLSMVEILYSLYFYTLNITPETAKDPCRDRLILGSSQGAMALYAVMHKRNFFEQSGLDNFLKKDWPLTTFPNIHTVPAVEMSAGSLGHGLSFGVGTALYAKRHSFDFNTFVLCGDGELEEGSIWEAIMSASHFKLNNLILIINRNYLQIGGTTEEIMGLDPLDKKLLSFGWFVKKVDGHDVDALNNALNSKINNNKPKAIIAKTKKGKGISFMENSTNWHFKIPTENEYAMAMDELK